MSLAGNLKRSPGGDPKNPSGGWIRQHIILCRGLGENCAVRWRFSGVRNWGRMRGWKRHGMDDG